jgi:predicted RNA-binding Zn-ribbon protein involved in translation (DUF1610 family)
MEGKRCTACGEVHWSILPRAHQHDVDCPGCGKPMVDERRRPGRRGARVLVERRDLPLPAEVS